MVLILGTFLLLISHHEVSLFAKYNLEKQTHEMVNLQ